MRSIKKTVHSELIINKSKFINCLVPVSTVDMVQDHLRALRKKYPDANHHCYAYIIGKSQEIQKYSDDGEPSKTAGMPMIEVLKKQHLTDILAVTIRYFGGIKLGAGGLVRAYTKSVSETVRVATLTNLFIYSKMTIIIPFDQIGNVEKYLRDHFKLLDTEYTNAVHYQVELKSDDVEKTISVLNEFTKGIVSCEVTEKYERYE